MPTRDGKDYSNWALYAQNRLAERCRNDFERYGVCSILYELTSFDADFALGVLDPVAFAGFQKTLDELEVLASQENAVFMTLGEFAAAQLIDDTQAPVITIYVPAATSYQHYEVITVDFDVTDDLSGVYSVVATLDGQPIQDGDALDLLTLSLGDHTLMVQAEDTAGNASVQNVTFTVTASINGLAATVQRMVDEGTITKPDGGNSLLSKLDAALAAYNNGKIVAAKNNLNAFINEVEAMNPKFISSDAVLILITYAAFVRDNL